MVWLIATVIVVAVLSTTPESRAAARERLARWNPLFFLLDLIGLYILYQMLFGPRIH